MAYIVLGRTFSRDRLVAKKKRNKKATMQRCSIANFTKDTKRVANFTSSVARMQREGFLATEKCRNTAQHSITCVGCQEDLERMLPPPKVYTFGGGSVLLEAIDSKRTRNYVAQYFYTFQWPGNPLVFFTLWTRPWQPLLQSHSWSSPHLGSYVVGPPQCSNPLHAFQSSFGSCWILASAYFLLSVHTHNETLDTTFLLSYKYHKGLLNIRLSLPALYKSCLGMKTFIMGEQLTLGSYYITDANVAKYAQWYLFGGMDITREMCSGAHIPRGNNYHCNTETTWCAMKQCSGVPLSQVYPTVIRHLPSSMSQRIKMSKSTSVLTHWLIH